MEFIRALIGPDTGDASPLQLCARALILFFFGIACLRIAGRRTFSQASPLDIIVAVIIGSNISRAMTGKAPFFGGLAATLVIVVLHRLLAMASRRSTLLGGLIKGEPTVLVRQGVVDPSALARHGLSEADLAEALRMQQVEDPSEVRLAMMERGGKISVLPNKP
jgi:uncharacterized membrane protein YcaP (DUF421 family)